MPPKIVSQDKLTAVAAIDATPASFHSAAGPINSLPLWCWTIHWLLHTIQLLLLLLNIPCCCCCTCPTCLLLLLLLLLWLAAAIPLAASGSSSSSSEFACSNLCQCCCLPLLLSNGCCLGRLPLQGLQLALRQLRDGLVAAGRGNQALKLAHLQGDKHTWWGGCVWGCMDT